MASSATPSQRRIGGVENCGFSPSCPKHVVYTTGILHAFALEAASMCANPRLRLRRPCGRCRRFPRSISGLYDRGLIQAGMTVDLAVFDPAGARDTATCDKSRQYSEGVPLI